MTQNKLTVQQLCASALGAALIAVCSWISIPSPTGIFFTLQTFAIFLVAGLLGTKSGTLSVLVYLLLGAVGLPVFAGFKGGVASLFGVTGGYLIGFLLTALTVGILTKLLGKKVPALILAMVLGLVLCYAFGSLWFQVVYTRTNDAGMTFWSILTICVIPYLIPDAVKMALAIFLVRRLDGHLPL